jgi:tRNA-specific 2-thiouridylase
LQTTNDVLVQSSAHGAAIPATVEILSNSSVRITWSEAQRRIAPGQSVVLYNMTNTHVLGGGIATAE